MLVGLLVNPIAGMGGRVGLKGTDGVIDEAIKRGATPIAPRRATEYLQTLESLHIGPHRLELVVCPKQMGEDVAHFIGLSYSVVEVRLTEKTDSNDTKKCVQALYKAGVRLLVFVGGDGTARDVLDAITEHNLDDL